MPHAEISGGRLHYEIIERGLNTKQTALALLLPQSTGPIGLESFIDRLARHHNVITYDQRGTGGSSPMSDTMSMATQATDFIGLLDALGVQRTALLCHSTGCGIGLSVAAKHPERVTALILASPWTYADAHLTTMQRLRIAAARALDPIQYAYFNAALLFPPDYRRAHQAGFERLATKALERPQDANEIEHRLSAILAFDARPLLPTIRSATLVISARDDQLMPIWFASEAVHTIPDSELLELDGGGHMILETRATEVSENILQFLG